MAHWTCLTEGSLQFRAFGTTVPLSNVHSRISDKPVPNKAHAEYILPHALVLAQPDVTIGGLPGQWSANL